jgi:hypothetical protein
VTFHDCHTHLRHVLDQLAFLPILDNADLAKEHPSGNELVYHLLEGALTKGTAEHILITFQKDRDGHGLYKALCQKASMIRDVKTNLDSLPVYLDEETDALEYINDFRNIKNLFELYEYKLDEDELFNAFTSHITDPDYDSVRKELISKGNKDMDQAIKFLLTSTHLGIKAMAKSKSRKDCVALTQKEKQENDQDSKRSAGNGSGSDTSANNNNKCLPNIPFWILNEVPAKYPNAGCSPHDTDSPFTAEDNAAPSTNYGKKLKARCAKRRASESESGTTSTTTTASDTTSDSQDLVTQATKKARFQKPALNIKIHHDDILTAPLRGVEEAVEAKQASNNIIGNNNSDNNEVAPCPLSSTRRHNTQWDLPNGPFALHRRHGQEERHQGQATATETATTAAAMPQDQPLKLIEVHHDEEAVENDDDSDVEEDDRKPAATTTTTTTVVAAVDAAPIDKDESTTNITGMNYENTTAIINTTTHDCSSRKPPPSRKSPHSTAATISSHATTTRAATTTARRNRIVWGIPIV